MKIKVINELKIETYEKMAETKESGVFSESFLMNVEEKEKKNKYGWNKKVKLP